MTRQVGMDPRDAERAARARQQELTKPAGSLGRLEDLAVQLAALQGQERPRVRPAAALIFAADHPVTAHRVSAYPSEVTRSMLANLDAGGAAASVLARCHDLPLRVLDVGVAGTPAPARIVDRHEVAAHARGDLRGADAMSAETEALARQAGRDAVAALDPDTRVVVLGEIGIGNTTPAAAVAAALLGRPAADLVGPGTGLEAEGVRRKARVVQEALDRVRATDPASPDARLRQLGGPDLSALVGAVLAAAERRIAVLVDGAIVSVAALAASRIDASVRAALIFSHRSAEPGHRLVLEALEAEPLLDLGMRLGEASGGLAAFPLVEAACRLHDEMATFAEASVPTALAGDESSA